MKGRVNKEGEWTDVRRWKLPANQMITAFYATNIPDGANCNKLREVFMEYGEVVDIYIARKKDASGSNFAFIRCRQGSQHAVSPTVIHLNVQEYKADMFVMKALAGKVHSLEHLYNFPTILEAYGVE
ncbi:unnamed protein product, partial [Lactuca virosa]